MVTLNNFLPIDRLYALAGHEQLPGHAHGSVLFADVPGFTPLTEAMAQVFGPQRGAEELMNLLNRVYTALIDPVHKYHGSVISFSGDSFNCWFDGDDGRRAAAAGLEMQAAVARLEPFSPRMGLSFHPSIKVAIAVGPVRRLLVGDPAILRLDVLTGSTLEVLDKVGHLAEREMVMIETSAASHLVASGAGLITAGERKDSESGIEATIINGLEVPVSPDPWPEWNEGAGDDQLDDVTHLTEDWLLPAVRERLLTGTERFLGELRPATVLFLNFGGLDYNDAEAELLLDAYLRKAQDCLVRYEGAPLQFNTGDKGNYLYAAFGAPLAHDDDASRAVAAALELLKISSDIGFISGARVGLAKGMMFAGTYGSPSRQTYALIGDKVNVAARLMQKAQPGEVLCDKEVFVQARRYWDFDSLSPVQLKGKAAPTPVYRPLRRRQAAPGTAADLPFQAGRLASLVGRQAEVARLNDLLDTLQAGTGPGLVLFVEGEAGIGKSRLVGTLMEMAKNRGLPVLSGSGQSIEQSVPYRAWRDVFQTYFDLREGDDLNTRQEKVRQKAEAAIPGMLQRLPLLNEVLALGLSENRITSILDPKLRRESLENLLVALLRIRLQAGPLVLVLEDAHWMDLPSWELARLLVRVMQLEKRSFLLVLVNRPLDETQPEAQVHQELLGLPISTVIALEILDDAALIALTAGLLEVSPQHLPPEIFRFIQTRSKGNPFFAEEMVQAMLDRGLIMVEPGEDGPVCRAHPDLDQEDQALPETLQGLILSRIDRLSTEQQLVLKVAAVIGRTFAYTPLRDTLTQFIPVVDSALKGNLSELVHQELTQLEIPEPELTYIFKHILTQEAAYQSLLFAQRKDIHLAVAKWYEALLQSDETLGPSMFPLLAYHYQQAEYVERERFYARKAGEAAKQVYANDSALTYFTRAIELTPPEDLESIYALRKSRQGIYALLGNDSANLEEINRMADIVDRLAEQAGGEPTAVASVVEKQAKTLLARSRVYSNQGKYESAEEFARQATALADQIQDTALQLDCRVELGFVMSRRGQINNADQELEPALELARASGLRNQEARLLHQLGVNADLSGNRVKSQNFFEQSLLVYRIAGERYGEGLLLNNLGISNLHRGNLAVAREYLEQALAIMREIGARSGEVYPLANIGLIFFQQRRYDETIDYLQQSLALARELNLSYVEVSSQCNLGSVYQVTGNFPLALSAYEDSLAIAQATGDRQREAFGLSNIANIYVLLGDFQTANGYLEKGLRISQEIGDLYTEADIERDLAIQHLWLGDQEQALAHCERSLAIVQQLEFVEQKETYLIVQGEIQFARNQYDQAEAAYQEALKVLNESGRPTVEAEAGIIRVDMARGDIARAGTRAAEILAFLEKDSVSDAINSTGIYLACYQALQAVGDMRSAELISKGYNFLQSQASSLTEKQRKNYFENLPSNKALLSLWMSNQPRG